MHLKKLPFNTVTTISWALFFFNGEGLLQDPAWRTGTKVVVESLGWVRRFLTPWTATLGAPLSSTVSRVCANAHPLSQRRSRPPCPLLASSRMALSLPQQQGLSQRGGSLRQVAKGLEQCSTFPASSFRIWHSSAGTPSAPLALLVVMLPKAHLTSYSRMYGSRWVITASW